jgi:ribose 1,5-bisphosphate isomerase
MEKAGWALAYARPTEPLAQNAVRFFLHELNCSPAEDVGKLRKLLADKADFLVKQVDDNKGKIVACGAGLIKKGDNILTHCHSSTVEKIIVQARRKLKDVKVFNTETRPLFQGRITSKNLLAAGVDVTMVADSFAPFLISGLGGADLSAGKVFLGGDLIAEDGSVVNKIGSFGIGLAADRAKVPLYAAVHLLKFNPAPNFQIERRSGREIWPGAPKGLKILNFAFDVIPAEFIAGIITEFGVIKPQDVKKVARQKYPWLFTEN